MADNDVPDTPVNGAPSTADQPAAPDGAPATITIRMCDQSGAELSFKLRPSTKLKKAMDAFSARMERDRTTLRFLFDGERVLDESTPESVSLRGQGERV